MEERNYKDFGFCGLHPISNRLITLGLEYFRRGLNNVRFCLAGDIN
jgi:hypothetical protein